MARYRQQGNSPRDIWLNPAVWAIGWYRLGNWPECLSTSAPPPPASQSHLPSWKQILRDLHGDVYRPQCLNRRRSLHRPHRRGPYQPRGHTRTELRHRASRDHRYLRYGPQRGRQPWGDNVYVGTGAAIIGKIRVASGAKIAANTLVISNIPPGATVMGVPGRIIMRPAAPRLCLPNRDPGEQLACLRSPDGRNFGNRSRPPSMIRVPRSLPRDDPRAGSCRKQASGHSALRPRHHHARPRSCQSTGDPPHPHPHRSLRYRGANPCLPANVRPRSRLPP